MKSPQEGVNGCLFNFLFSVTKIHISFFRNFIDSQPEFSKIMNVNERSFLPPATPISKSEATFRRLLDCAYRQFSKNGYAGTSMRGIADETGIALGSIYNHFDSKEAIFRAVLLQYHPFIRLFPVFSSVNSATIDDFLRQCTQLVLKEVDSHPEFLNLLLIEFIEFQGRHARLLFTKYRNEMEIFGQRFYAFKDQIIDVPPGAIVRMYMSMVIGYLVTDVALRDLINEGQMERTVNIFVNTFLHGIVVRDSHPNLEEA